jgi:hypothetical protein
LKREGGEKGEASGDGWEIARNQEKVEFRILMRNGRVDWSK